MHTVKTVLENIPIMNLPDNICILDIETGGFSHKYSPVLLLGLAYIEDKKWVAEIHLCEDRFEEPLLLSLWAQALNRFLVFITYYGKGFDIPFLTKRSAHHDLPIVLSNERHIDLYQKGTLKENEKLAGFIRKDQLSGKDWTQIYKLFEKIKENTYRELLLLHNHDDLSGTIHLLLSRDEMRESLRYRMIQDKFISQTFPSPGNLRLLAIDMNSHLWCMDLPLLSFGRYHFLHVGELFDQMSSDEKKGLLLLDGRNPNFHTIHSLLNNEELRHFLVDNEWRRC